MATILIVDDSCDAGAALAALLRHRGHRAVHASGGTAMDYVVREMPDLVVLDLMMPDVTGLEVLRRIRQDARTARVPVAMYTAAGEGPEAQAKEAGVDAYWVKGVVSAEEILDRIDGLLAPTAAATR